MNLRDTAPDLADVERWLADVYGIECADVAVLDSEIDLVLRLATARGERLVFRLSSRRRSESALACQVEALRHLEAVRARVPTPRVVPSLRGNPIERMPAPGGERLAHVIGFMDGVPINRTAGSAAQRAAIGACLAELDLALAGLSTPLDGDPGPWNVERADTQLPLLGARDQPATALAARFLIRYAGETRRRVARLPRQLIHNDFNGKNILVAADDPARVVAVIDFGDIVRAPRIVDLAIAVAKLARPEAVVSDSLDFARGYAARAPVGADEWSELYDLACTRLAVRVAVWFQRAGEGLPEAHAPLRAAAAQLDAFANAEAGLRRAFDALAHAAVERRLAS